jgi:hypothetical protein
MRALLKIDTNLDRTQFIKILNDNAWIPNFEPKSDMYLQHKNEIVNQIPKEKGYTESSFVCLIYDDNEDTWGLVTSTNPTKYIIRFKNLKTNKLKETCTNFIKTLINNPSLVLHNNIKPHFKFKEKVEIFEPNSEHSIIFGDLITTSAFGWILVNKKTEFYFALTTLIFAVLAFLISRTIHLPAQEILHSSANPNESWKLIDINENKHWYKDVLQRLGTTSLVSFFATLFPILFDYFKNLKTPKINWKSA